MLYQAVAMLSMLGVTSALAMSPAGLRSSGRGVCVRMGTTSDEMGIPCIGECALNAYPNMPGSVHPGVVTGDALVDLLDDAKAKGYAIPAVNCVTSSSVNTCLEAARKMDAPIIIQFSSGGAQFYAGKGLD